MSNEAAHALFALRQKVHAMCLLIYVSGLLNIMMLQAPL